MNSHIILIRGIKINSWDEKECWFTTYVYIPIVKEVGIHIISWKQVDIYQYKHIERGRQELIESILHKVILICITK